MKPKRSKETYTQEEILTLSDVEIVSNWAKLSSLIRAYEKADWEQSKKKALELKKEGAAFDYVKTVRAFPDGNFPQAEPILVKEPIKSEKPPKVKTVDKYKPSIYEKNYERLLEIAPDLEEELLRVDSHKDYEFNGYSESSGSLDFSMKLAHRNDSGYFILLSHYQIQNGNTVREPDIHILLNLKKQTIEALELTKAGYHRKVYDDILVRKLTNLTEQKTQNEFLSKWLRDLKSQGHKIVWRKSNSHDHPASEIIDEYQKKESDNPTITPQKKEIESKNVTGVEIEAPQEPTTPEKEKVEVIESAKTTKMAIEFSDKQTKKMPSIILLLEGVKAKNPEQKTNELIENGKAVDYLINGYDRVKNDKLRALLEINYYKLQFVLPKIYLQKGSPKNTLILAPTVTGTTLTYYLSDVTQMKRNREFAIYESASKTHLGGSLNIGFSDQTRYAWVSLIAQGFDGHEDFLSEEPLVFSDKQYQVNQEFGKWLDYLLSKKYEYMWLSKDLKEPLGYIDEDENKPTIPKSETPIVESTKVETPVVETPVEEPPKVEDPPKKKSYYINAEIPRFELGHVKLTEQHIKHGLTQSDINWINKHKQGFTIIPRKKVMVYNTRSISMDKAIKAKAPGFRVSAFGLFNYESRSNRSDRTRDGL